MRCPSTPQFVKIDSSKRGCRTMVVRELPSLRRWLDFQRNVRVAKCLHADTAFLHYAGANALNRFSIMRPVDAMLELAITP